MRAMIFAAGLGTRLRPLTDLRPKALVEIDHRPMLEHLILKLKREGFREIVINIHHKGEMILDFLKSHDDFGLDILVSDERQQLLDTGGGILKARDFLKGAPFLVHNVDIVSDIPLQDLARQHSSSGALATLAVSSRKTSRYLLFDKGLSMRGWQNIQTGEVLPLGTDLEQAHLTPLAFQGIHILEPDVLDLMGEGTPWTGKFSIIPFYTDICQSHEIKAFQTGAYKWFDIGKVETLLTAQEWMQGR